MSTDQLPANPRPHHLVEAEINSYRKSAESSLGWNEKLGNPGSIKALGRFLLNSVGVESPEQRAMHYHDGIIENYANYIAVSPDKVKQMSNDEHIHERQKVIVAKVDSGEVVVEPLPNSEITQVGIRPIGTPRQSGIKYQLGRMLNTEPMPEGVRSLKIMGRKDKNT